MAKPKDVCDLLPVQQIWFYGIASEDFKRAALSAIAARGAAANDRLSFEHRAALIESAVVRYARPFSRCFIPHNATSSDAQLSAQLRKDFLPDAVGVRDFHQNVMDLRDTIVAHSDLEHRPVWIRRRDIEGREWRVDTSVLLPDMGDENLDQLSRLATTLREQTAVAVGELVMRHFGTLPLDQWAKTSGDTLEADPNIPWMET